MLLAEEIKFDLREPAYVIGAGFIYIEGDRVAYQLVPNNSPATTLQELSELLVTNVGTQGIWLK
jgi:hypothetical protein